ncbi:uncharacterized protein [Rutidosis leptorrhynchoides]|uniref:uncharacterized protein n=1 Tax=Rutidosis leptorrhynchoides TaxID=125765 RepID=UPI003A998784
MENEEVTVIEALRLKSIAETKFKSSNLKSALKYAKKAQQLSPALDGLSPMLTAFTILRAADSPPENSDWYETLQVEPFSHINTIKKQYKKLALVLHPDKNPYLGCEEAFKLVGEAFRVLSDRIRRKEYDMKLRIRMQDEKLSGFCVETFWTACSECRLMLKFERKYLGHNLVCTSCKKSFLAVEVEEGSGNDGVGADESDDDFKDTSLKEFMGKMGLKKKRVKTREDGDEESERQKKADGLRSEDLNGKVDGGGGRSTELAEEIYGSEWGGGRLWNRRSSQKTSTVAEVLARSKENEKAEVEPKAKKAKIGEETMTLAEMQLRIRKGVVPQKEKSRNKGKSVEEKEKETDEDEEEPLIKLREFKIRKRNVPKKSVNIRTDSDEMGKNAKRKNVVFKSEELEIMDVDDSDFYDFDKDRIEKSFKQGQVWAVYNDDDGMPRHYALVDEVSVNPFRLGLSWLDLMNNRDNCENMGFHVSCGKFKAGEKDSTSSLNIFSHVVGCERAAREIYRIYPKKGSVWAIYDESELSSEAGNSNRRFYQIVVLLTTYTEMHGLSMAYLEKVNGYKTVFKRREIGRHAIRWLEKDNFRLFSHQIPARKFTGDEVPNDLKDCWELDPASLPSDLLSIG